ncbi:MAG: redoxin domain-containing protein [Armatimonadota bacterium]
MKLAIGHKAHDVSASDLHGNTVQLGSLWATNPAVFFFHSHPCSGFAKQAFNRIECISGQLEARGVTITSIVPTSSNNACAFYREGDYWHTYLADPTLNCHLAYGVPIASPSQAYSVSSLSAAVRAYRRGYRLTGLQTIKAFMLPSVIVVGTDGLVRAIRYGNHVGDVPSQRELLCLASGPPADRPTALPNTSVRFSSDGVL